MMVQRAVLSVGTFGKGTGIVGIVDTALAEILLPSGAVQGDTWMTVSFEDDAARWTSDCAIIYGLMATWAVLHR